jgi:hypothetical protein
METASQSFKRDIEQAKKREQELKAAMNQVAHRLGARFPKNYSRQPGACLALFMFDDEKDVNMAKRVKDEAEQMLREELIKAGWTAAEARRVEIHFESKQELTPPKS